MPAHLTRLAGLIAATSPVLVVFEGRGAGLGADCPQVKTEEKITIPK
jgi:hypothetical protein